MIEKRTFNGYWNLPNSQSHTPGELIFDPFDKPNLELLGHLDGGNAYNVLLSEPLIHGFSVDGKSITLINNARSGSSMSMPGIPTISYRPTYILIGEHLAEPNKAIYSDIEVEIDPLTQWVDIWGFSYLDRDDKRFLLEYNLPDSINFSINERLHGSIEFAGNLTKGLYEKLDGTHKAKLHIHSEDLLTLDDILEHAWHFKKLLTYATLDDTHFKVMYLKSPLFTNSFGNELLPKRLELLYFQRDLKLGDRKTHRMYFLFTYPKIAEQFESIVQNWYSKRELMQPIVDIEYENLSKTEMLLETSFLSSVQALETYHRRVRQNTEELKLKHEGVLASILDKLTADEREYINGKLQYSYEPSLMQRLKSLIKEFDVSTIKKLLGTQKQIKSFIYKVVDSRNYYTHYDLRLKKQVLKDQALSNATQKLRAILLVAILNELGFDKTTIEQMLTDIEGYKYGFLVRG